MPCQPAPFTTENMRQFLGPSNGPELIQVEIVFFFKCCGSGSSEIRIILRYPDRDSGSASRGMQIRIGIKSKQIKKLPKPLTFSRKLQNCVKNIMKSMAHLTRMKKINIVIWHAVKVKKIFWFFYMCKTWSRIHMRISSFDTNRNPDLGRHQHGNSDLGSASKRCRSTTLTGIFKFSDLQNFRS
jgi:hypothetical protein